jgi:hypothetical protein
MNSVLDKGRTGGRLTGPVWSASHKYFRHKIAIIGGAINCGKTVAEIYVSFITRCRQKAVHMRACSRMHAHTDKIDILYLSF